jgi:hypothetical protein
MRLDMPLIWRMLRTPQTVIRLAHRSCVIARAMMADPALPA